MKTSAVVLALTLVSSANAAMIATAETEDPLASMHFHDDQGPCLGVARKAEFVKTGSPTIVGCWVVRAGGYVTVAWLDGDMDKVPLSALNHDVL